MMPNFRETSPSKIAAGFGGTLNLVLSALYIMVVVVLTALPCHFYLLAGKGPWGAAFVDPQYLKLWLVLGTGAAIVVGAVAPSCRCGADCERSGNWSSRNWCAEQPANTLDIRTRRVHSH